MTTTKPDFLTFFRQNRKQSAYALFVLAALFAVIPIYLVRTYQTEQLPAAVWGGLLALTALGGGLWLLMSEGGPVAGMDEERVIVLQLGGVAGFATWVLALALAYQWRTTVFGGLEAWQGEKAWQLWVVILAMFGGLAVMFVSLLPARVATRASAGVRRLVYGYNAVLTGLLTLAILMVVNVLVYNYAPASFDWTGTQIYTLSERSQNILKAVDRPTTIYSILSRNEEIASREVKTLLDNARSANDKITVKYLSPGLNEEEVRDLARKYSLTEVTGLLVVYGDGEDAQHQFVRAADLFANDPSARSTGKASFLFKGEDALVTALNSLEEGKAKAVVYFLQGDGELDLNEQAAGENDRGAGVLRERLQKNNYEVKGLQLTPVAGARSKDARATVSTKVPDDATVVVVAGPGTPLPESTVKALGEYMTRPASATVTTGKLMVLLDVNVDPAGNQVPSGLEAFLAGYGVLVGNDRIIKVVERGGGLSVSLSVTAQPNPRMRGANPLPRTFYSLNEVRTVKPAPFNPNQPSRTSAETLLFAMDRTAWAETNLRTAPVELVKAYLKDNQLENKLADEPLSVAVAVTEEADVPPGDPHAMMRPREGKPRLVVFGDATFATNRFMQESSGRPDYYLFSGALGWLRERPASLGLEAKTRNIFAPTSLNEENFSRMHFLPAAVLLLCVAGLGASVWLVRRR